ncbi:unannotated protein [freshwater metagenome]|uniref:Unannotated protein n=1 Tax=freshwater metagenome TaxID=449393 RepID=A0A6J7JFW8_9ZZZZ|nr:ATP-binding cassette domain-containing protein [Actinomycetota bacterium]
MRLADPRWIVRSLPVAVVVLVLLLIPPVFLSEFDQYNATTAAIFAIALLGLGVVTGRAALICLAQTAFMAVGAFVILWLNVHAPGMPFLIKLVIASLITVPIGVLVSLPALRLRGINLGVVTLAFSTALTVYLSVKGFPGAKQANFIERPDALMSEGSFYLFAAGAFIVVALIVTILGRTNIGSSWSALRESERATAALGRSAPIAKMTAFGVSALCGGVAGAIFAVQLGTAEPSGSLSPLGSLSLFALAIMVGSRFVEGALIGGALFAFMPTILKLLGLPQDIGDIFFGVGAILGLRRGFGAAEDIRDVLHRRRRKTAELGVAEPPVGYEPPSVPAPADGSAAALVVEGLTFSYGQVKALEDVSITVPHGSVVALIGPNGAGKSTFIDCVTGFNRSYSGSVSAAGSPIDGYSAHERAHHGVRRSFQQGRTIPDLSIEEYLRLGLSREQRRVATPDFIDDLLAFFSCPPRDTRVGDIDVGTRRLLEVAGAVAAQPELVLLDEPAAGLGGEESEEIARRIAEIPGRYGPSVLLVEHDMELVTAIAQHVVVLDFGRVIADGTPDVVLSDPKVVSAYLGEEVEV